MRDFMKKVDGINIRYNNVHPSDSEKTYIESTIDEIYGESPYGAVITAKFTDRRGTVKGVLQINSSAGSFFATAESHDLVELTKKLNTQIKKRLDRWKEKRFKVHHNNFTPSMA